MPTKRFIFLFSSFPSPSILLLFFFFRIYSTAVRGPRDTTALPFGPVSCCCCWPGPVFTQSISYSDAVWKRRANSVRVLFSYARARSLFSVEIHRACFGVFVITRTEVIRHRFHHHRCTNGYSFSRSVFFPPKILDSNEFHFRTEFWK